jgi:hypothetical protein
VFRFVSVSVSVFAAAATAGVVSRSRSRGRKIEEDARESHGAREAGSGRGQVGQVIE